MCPQKMKTSSIKPYKLEISSIEKDTSRRTLFNLIERTLSDTFKWPLCQWIPRNRLLDSMTHVKNALNPEWTCISSSDLKVKIFWNWRRWHLMKQLSQISGPGLLEVCCQTFDDDITLQMISYDLGYTWTLDKKMSESFPFYSPLLLEWDLNKFPVCAFFLWHKTLHSGKIWPGAEGQKPAKTRKPDPWSVIFSEKYVDQQEEIYITYIYVCMYIYIIYIYIYMHIHMKVINRNLS